MNRLIFLNARKPQPHTPRPQTLSLNEAAKEFGVGQHRLAQLAANRAGPKPLQVGNTRSNGKPRVAYYVAKDIRAWWQTVKDQL